MFTRSLHGEDTERHQFMEEQRVKAKAKGVKMKNLRESGKLARVCSE